jgi:hypothetical protein
MGASPFAALAGCKAGTESVLLDIGPWSMILKVVVGLRDL